MKMVRHDAPCVKGIGRPILMQEDFANACLDFRLCKQTFAVARGEIAFNPFIVESLQLVALGFCYATVFAIKSIFQQSSRLLPGAKLVGGYAVGEMKCDVVGRSRGFPTRQMASLACSKMRET